MEPVIPLAAEEQALLKAHPDITLGYTDAFEPEVIVTHKIDSDVDETRSYLIQDLWYSQGLEQVGFVKGVGAAPIEAPRDNLTGDPYFTDGLRAVLWLSSQPVAFEQVKFLAWELPSR